MSTFYIYCYDPIINLIIILKMVFIIIIIIKRGIKG